MGFHVTCFRDDVILPAKHLQRDEGEALLYQLNKKYTDKVFPGIGLVVGVHSLTHIGAAVVHHNEGSPVVSVEFLALVWAPAPRSLIKALIIGQSKTLGMRFTTGFFDEIYVSPDLLPKQIVWADDKGCYCVKKGDTMSPIEMPCEVFLTVLETVFCNIFRTEADAIPPKVQATGPDAPPPTEHPAGRHLRPMLVSCSMRGAGLGRPQWWGMPGQYDISEFEEALVCQPLPVQADGRAPMAIDPVAAARPTAAEAAAATAAGAAATGLMAAAASVTDDSGKAGADSASDPGDMLRGCADDDDDGGDDDGDEDS